MALTGEDFVVRKAELLGVLEHLCQGLELTDTQFQTAKERYEAVGAWLAAAEDPMLRALAIYLQGSTALGTTVKPISRSEHDVDLVVHNPDLSSSTAPGIVKRVIGDRLKLNGRYAAILEEMPRCWRLNYANEFHLDITPSIVNPACVQGGELVPDKKVREWCASNPKGYKALFEHRASLQPRLRLLEEAVKQLRADIEPYPISRGPKGILRRVVQILKRHRDYQFEGDPALAPISVVITTLASRSYEYCVSNLVFEDEFDLLCAVIREMPRFIETQLIDGQKHWFVWNETTTEENFAEKWNHDPRLARAFFDWHVRALADIERLVAIDGLDSLTKSLSQSFGSGPANRALERLTKDISAARALGQLSVAPVVGLRIGQSPRSTTVKTNTFFGE
jgi:SMODS domain-containing protein